MSKGNLKGISRKRGRFFSPSNPPKPKSTFKKLNWKSNERRILRNLFFEYGIGL
jgi:hypothetical protein